MARAVLPLLGAALAAWLGWRLLAPALAPDAALGPPALAVAPPAPAAERVTEPLEAGAEAERAGAAAAPEAEPMLAGGAPRVLRGRVLDQAGQPLPGATVVRVQGMLDRSRWERATSGADGTYALSFALMALSAERAAAAGEAGRETWIEVEAGAEGCETARAQAVVSGDALYPGRLDFTLARRVALAGRVTWADGAPCADASLVVERPLAAGAFGFSRLGRQLAATRTDATGAFRVETAGGQVVDLLVDTAGYAPAEPVRVVLPAAGAAAAQVVLSRPAALLVRLAGGPDDLLASLGRGTPRLRLVRPDGLRAGLVAQPLLSREIRFEAVDPGPAWDLALALGGSQVTLRSGLRLAAGEPSEVEVALDDALLERLRGGIEPQPARTLGFSWRMTDEAGATLSTAEFSRRALLSEDCGVPVRATSLATGERGVASCEALGSSEMHGRGFVAGIAAPVELEFRLGEQAVRRGPVQDGDALEFVVPEPQGLARLRVLASDGYGAARLPTDLRVQRLDAPEMRLVLPDTRTGACSALLPPGDYVVVAAPQGLPVVSRRVRLAAGEERTIELAMGTAGLVRGRVQPAPAAGRHVLVQAYPADGAGFEPPATASVGADGAFELAGLAAGEWLLVALSAVSAGEPATPACQRVRVVAGQETAAVLLLSETPGRSVRVRRAARGAGLVRLEGLDSGLQVAWPLAPGDERRLVLPPGRYRCATLPVGRGAWPLDEPAPPIDFELRPDDPPDELRLDA